MLEPCTLVGPCMAHALSAVVASAIAASSFWLNLGFNQLKSDDRQLCCTSALGWDFVPPKFLPPKSSCCPFKVLRRCVCLCVLCLYLPIVFLHSSFDQLPILVLYGTLLVLLVCSLVTQWVPKDSIAEWLTRFCLGGGACCWVSVPCAVCMHALLLYGSLRAS